MTLTKRNFLLIFLLLPGMVFTKGLSAQDIPDSIRVGLAGSAPFVINNEGQPEGISVEIWESLMETNDFSYQYQQMPDVATALKRLKNDELDVVVGPVSITSERAETARFTQPYFLSSLVIASKVNDGGLWQIIRPFFSPAFFTALGFLLVVLACVGTLIWLAERKASPDQFPERPLPGIFNGIWFALVTMTTVGYGDKAPKTVAGKVISGIWMVVALVTATSLIAGISSTITVGQLSSSAITTAEQMSGHSIAVVAGSPAADFVKSYGGRAVTYSSLEAAFAGLDTEEAEALAYDRPQLMYYLKEHPDTEVTVSTAEYMPQGYGFAFQRKNSVVTDSVNVQLLRFQEAKGVEPIVEAWLGNEQSAAQQGG